MKLPELAWLQKQMKKELEPARYEHTLGVAYTAANLATVHGADVQKALTAGMLHDCTKCLSHKKQLILCDKNQFALSEMERAEGSPLLHAKSGCVQARVKYGVTDEDILNAICYHTTGRPDMSLLEKIIYTADYLEPGRRHAKRTGREEAGDRLTQIRREAFRDIDEALRDILSDTLAYLENKKIDLMTKSTYDFYMRMQGKDRGDTYEQ